MKIEIELPEDLQDCWHNAIDAKKQEATRRMTEVIRAMFTPYTIFTIGDCIRAVEGVTGYTLNQLREANQRQDRIDARCILSSLLREYLSQSAKQIADWLWKERSSISHYFKRHKDLMQTSRAYQQQYEAAKAMLLTNAND